MCMCHVRVHVLVTSLRCIVSSAMARSVSAVRPEHKGAVHVSKLANAAMTAHAAPHTLTRIVLTSAKPWLLVTGSAPPATPVVVCNRRHTARHAPCTWFVPVAHPHSGWWSETG